MTTNAHHGNIHTFDNLTLCKVNYFETCWCKSNSTASITCPYLLRYVQSLSNSNYFCTYHTIRKAIECFNSTIVYPQREVISSVYITLTIVLFLIGLIGNGLSIIILFHKNLRRLSVYQNLIILCALNIIYLFTILIRHQNPYKKDLRDISGNLCRMHRFLVALTGHLCSWQLVSTSTQRVHALLSLHSQRRYSWKQTLSIFIICVLTPLVILDGQILFNYGIFTRSHMCDENTSHESRQFQRALQFPLDAPKNVSIRYFPTFFQTVKNQTYSCQICILWNALDTFIYTILPFCALLISSIIIVTTICKRRRSTIHLGGQCHTPKKDNSSILLIIINCVFLILIGPLEICLIGQSLMKIFSPRIFALLNQAFRLLQNSYHASSFLFYCANGNKFRQTAMKLLQRVAPFDFKDQSNKSTMNIYFRKQATPTTSSQDLTKRLSTKSGKKRSYLTVTSSDAEMKPSKTFV